MKELVSDIDEPVNPPRHRNPPDDRTIWETVQSPAPVRKALSFLEPDVHALESGILAFPEERLHERVAAREPRLLYYLPHGAI